MTIATGDPIPDVKVFTFGESGPQATTSGELLGTGKVVLFAVPGRLHPDVLGSPPPGLRAAGRRDQGEGRGQDRLYLGQRPLRHGGMGRRPERGAVGAHGLRRQRGIHGGHGPGHGRQRRRLGSRSQRYAAIIEDGIVTWLGVEPGPGSTPARPKRCSPPFDQSGGPDGHMRPECLLERVRVVGGDERDHVPAEVEEEPHGLPGASADRSWPNA